MQSIRSFRSFKMSVADYPVGLSDNAAKRVKQLIAQEGNPDMKLRIMITSGGCSGFSYNFSLDDQIKEDDQLFKFDGVDVLVDESSLAFVDGAVLDYVEDLMGASFQMTNPNATASCGCGSSFSV
jgi:iron-sulfur cluster insertion protein